MSVQALSKQLAENRRKSSSTEAERLVLPWCDFLHS